MLCDVYLTIIKTLKNSKSKENRKYGIWKYLTNVF